MINYFILIIAKRYARWTVLSWAFLLLVDICFTKIEDEPRRMFISPLGIVFVTFLIPTILNTTRWSVFWRRTASSIKEFWLGVSGILILSLILNGLCYYFLASVFPAEQVNFNEIKLTEWDFIWMSLIAFTLSFALLSDVRLTVANYTLQPARHVFIGLGIYIFIGIMVALFIFVRLLGYTFVVSSILCFFFLENSFVVDSIKAKLRYKAAFISVVVVLIFSFVSYQAALRSYERGRPLYLLGILGPKNLVSFADIDKVQTASAWIMWKMQVGELNSEQLILALSKLETLCPPEPTDSPAVVQCIEAKIEDEFVFVSGGLDSEAIQKLLTDEHVYSKLLGLLSARGLAEFSPEIKNMIENIAKTNGRLSQVAEVTLARHKKGEGRKLRVFVTASR